MKRTAVLAAAVVGMSWSQDASAVELAEGRLNLSSFGGWNYGVTRDNAYLSGEPGGDWVNANLSLTTTAKLTDDVTIAAQLGIEGGHRRTTLLIDFAFADWRVNDWARVRAGAVKHPFGISTEVFDVGTLRPFYFLPQALYGPVGFVAESYNGIGAVFTAPVGGWFLTLDVYGGGLSTNENTAPSQLLRQGIEEVETDTLEPFEVRNVIGGRLNVETPLEGLRFGVSGYGGSHEDIGIRYAAGAHLEYLTDVWSIRVEGARRVVALDSATGLGDHDITNAAYAEVAYRLTEHWQVALQGGVNSLQLVDVAAPAAPRLLRHLEGAVGVNYWFNPNVVFKAAYHRIEGNRLAIPEEVELDALAEIVPSTNFFTAGVQFAF